jgi:hypothetical protein
MWRGKSPSEDHSYHHFGGGGSAVALGYGEPDGAVGLRERGSFRVMILDLNGSLEGCESGLLATYKGKKWGKPNSMELGFSPWETLQLNGNDVFCVRNWMNRGFCLYGAGCFYGICADFARDSGLSY